MAEHERAATNSCPACDDARRAAIETEGLLQCVCGTWHGADDARWPRPTPEPTTGVRMRPGLDAPLGTIAEPRRDRPRVRLEAEAEEVARVRRLLAELRPYGPGPDGDPAATPAQGTGASLEPRAGGGRAPWDVDAPKGAFQYMPPALDAEVCARIARVPSERSRAALEYLRTRGTMAPRVRPEDDLATFGRLHLGYGPLAIRTALAVVDAVRVEAWQKDEAHGADRARVWGAKRLDEACAAWEATR